MKADTSKWNLDKLLYLYHYHFNFLRKYAFSIKVISQTTLLNIRLGLRCQRTKKQLVPILEHMWRVGAKGVQTEALEPPPPPPPPLDPPLQGSRIFRIKVYENRGNRLASMLFCFQNCPPQNRRGLTMI